MAEHRRVDSLNLSEEILNKGGIVRIPTVGSSMYPLFRKGDFIFIESVDTRPVSVGDIIVCRRGRRMVAHRLIKICRDNGRKILLTKGDTFSKFDEPVCPENVLGRITAIERRGRYININRGLYGAINIFCAKLSPFSKWIYPPLRRIKYRINKIKNGYAD